METRQLRIVFFLFFFVPKQSAENREASLGNPKCSLSVWLLIMCVREISICVFEHKYLSEMKENLVFSEHWETEQIL